MFRPSNLNEQPDRASPGQQQAHPSAGNQEHKTVSLVSQGQPSEQETAEILEKGMSLASVVGAGFDKLTDKQKRFAALYVLHQGNGLEAARGAGYSAPDVQSVRVRLNPKVAELIQLLALADAKATLPVAVSVLVDIATGFDVDESGKRTYRAPPSERRKAAMDLVRIAGGLPQAGPSVAVQVNAGQGDGASSPSVVIQNVWTNRSGRLAGIAAPMHDMIEHDASDPDDAADG